MVSSGWMSGAMLGGLVAVAVLSIAASGRAIAASKSGQMMSNIYKTDSDAKLARGGKRAKLKRYSGKSGQRCLTLPAASTRSGDLGRLQSLTRAGGQRCQLDG